MKKKLLKNSFPKKKFNSKEKISKLKKELILDGFSCQKIRWGEIKIKITKFIYLVSLCSQRYTRMMKRLVA
jgi:hypothetical protein